jgi:flagellar hook-associated protein 1 FlgK
MPDAMLIGLSGLQSHQRAIEVTSHNIANASTPGYTRQRADLAANAPENIALGQIGRGVTVEAIKRVANDLIIERIRQSQSETTRLSALDQTLTAAEQTFNEPVKPGFRRPSTISSQALKIFLTTQSRPLCAVAWLSKWGRLLRP